MRLPQRAAVLLAAVLSAATPVVGAVPARAEIGAYLLFDMADGTVLAEHRASTLWYPASITKLMTAYVTFEAVRDGRMAMTSPVKISPQARQQPPSRMGFALGTVITVETALRIILTKSANDVAFALAEAVGGTQGEFVDRMNAAARTIGMTSTNYDNPHGLPNRAQVSTARDIALLTMALARDFPDRADFFSMGGVRLGGRIMPNYNALVRRFEGADGMKTGFICSSGFNIAASATRDGVRLGAVVLGGLTPRERDERTAELLAKGFEANRTEERVALDGFDQADGRLDLATVAGRRPDLGAVDALPAAPAEVPAVDRKNVVCGARRPLTRYSDGAVRSAAEVEAQRGAVARHRMRRAAFDAQRLEILAAPRQLPSQPSIPERALADAELRPQDWAPERLDALLPAAHPNRATASAEAASDELATPSAERSAPSGELAAPSGERAAPSDELAAPSGEQAARSGEPAGVSGEAAVPSGETAAVSGEVAVPSGETAAFSGEAVVPSDETAAMSVEAAGRSDQAAAISVEAAGRSDQAAASFGEAVAPSDQAAVSSGEAVSLAGDAAVPSGEAMDTRATAASSPPSQPASLAPEDWTPSRPWPQSNPFQIADLRTFLGEPPVERPLTYLGPARAYAPVSIAIGGADAQRPDPLSGAIVGGGPPPVPRARPERRTATVFDDPADPDAMLQHVSEVRGKVAVE